MQPSSMLATRILASLCAALLLLALAFPAPAASVSWTNLTGGSWGTVGNWNSVGPANTNRLTIASGNYTVTLDDATADSDPGGASTKMIAAGTTTPGLTLGTAVNSPTLLINYTNLTKVLVLTATTGESISMLGNSSLIISNGTVEAMGTGLGSATAIGNAAGASPTLALHGAGAVYRTTNNISIGAVAGSTGLLDVAAGTLIADGVTVGAGTLAAGRGVGTWYARGNSTNVVGIVIVGSSTGSVGRLYIQDNAIAQFRTLNIGNDNGITRPGMTGLVYVTGGSLTTTGNQVNSFLTKGLSYGLFSVSNATATFSDAIQAAAVAASTGAFMEIQVSQGGKMSVGGALTLGGAAPGSTAIVNVTGSGLLELKSSLVLGGTGGAGFVSNSSGATIQFTGVNNPTVTVNAGSSFVTTDASIEFKNTSAFTTNAFSKITFQGSNTLSLLNATNANIANFTVGSGQNFAALRLAGASSLWQGANLTIASGGTLVGSGAIGSVNVTNAGVISPGNSPGTITFASNLTLVSSSVLNMELAGTNNLDRLLVNGDFVRDGTLNVTLLSYTPVFGDAFDLFDFASVMGTFSATNLPTLSGSLFWDFTQFDSAGVLLVNAIPEPATLALVLAAGLGWAVAFRRRAS